MTVVTVANPQAGPQGASVAVGNLPAGTTLSAAGGQIVYDTAYAQDGGTYGVKFVSTANNSCSITVPFQVSHAKYATEFQFTTPTAVPSADVTIASLRRTTGVLSRCVFKTTQELQIQSLSGGASVSIKLSVPLNTKYTLSWLVERGTATVAPFDGKVTCRLRTYPAGVETQTAAPAAALSTVVNLGNIDDFFSMAYGVLTALVTPLTLGFGLARGEDNRTTELPAFTPPSNQAPTHTLTASQTVTGTTATIVDTVADDGTVVTATWALFSTTSGSAPSISTSNSTLNQASVTSTGNITSLTAGTHVFKNTAVDNNGASSVGTHTVYVQAATVYPNAQISNTGGWTTQDGTGTLYAVLADNSDATYAVSTSAADCVMVIGVNPISAGDDTITVRCRVDPSDTSGQPGTFKAKLFGGTTLITSVGATWTLDTNWANKTLALSVSENATAATFRNDLRIELTANPSS